MRRTGKYTLGAVLALCMTAAAAGPAEAKEERTPVGLISLNFESDIQAGQSDGTVDVTLEDGECSVESVEIVNEGECWLGGDRPKVKVWLSADSDYYFKKKGKSAFSFSGDEVKYVSSSTKYDKEALVLTVTLDKLDEEDEDLDVGNLQWDELNGIAHWDTQNLADNYKVRLCKSRSSSSFEDGIGSVYTVKETSFDFSELFPKAGTYYFKVRAVDARDNAGEWQDSSVIEVTAEDLAAWKGSWNQDDRGWWYRNRDGSYTKDNWQLIGSEWYYFDGEGYMKTGWIQWQGKEYYCDESGAMMVSSTTPDGSQVGEDGARLEAAAQP